jgi:hypothetical protein
LNSLQCPKGLAKPEGASTRQKYQLNIFRWGTIVSEWLATDFTFFGVHFQNWMPIALVVVVLCVVFQVLRGSYRGRN